MPSLVTQMSLKPLAGCLMIAASITGCGGGGGGGAAPGAYNGTWQVTGVKVVDQCRSAAPGVLRDTVYVDHRGSSVNVRIGSSSLSGQVTDKDGFDVRGFEDKPNSCKQGVGIEFREASDGSAAAIVAIALECNGKACGIAYAGTATRTSSKAAEDASDVNQIDLFSQELQDSAANSPSAVDGGVESTLEETILMGAQK